MELISHTLTREWTRTVGPFDEKQRFYTQAYLDALKAGLAFAAFNNGTSNLSEAMAKTEAVSERTHTSGDEIRPIDDDSLLASY